MGRFRYPRNEQSRRDRILQHEIVNHSTRNHKSRNDAIAANPYGIAGLIATLTGTAIAGGVTEAQMVTGGETLIVTLEGEIWHADIGADNAITTAFLAGITGNDDYATIAALTDFGDVVRTSDTVVTLVWPAGVGYSILANETVTVAVPASVLASNKGVGPIPVTFDITEGA